ncbi:hypothetical protein [Microbulbifer agarilyticus]|nr:hypothetical protein [Microbulbifer agarilyticus]
MKYLVPLFLLLLQGCDPWQNDDEAILHSYVELNGKYYGYYSQQMWDGTNQFLIITEFEPVKYVKLSLGEPEILEGVVLARDFRHGSSLSEGSVSIENDTVVFCSAGGCQNITKPGK